MNEKEILRYLGYGRHEADEQTLLLIRECYGELELEAGPRHICREFPLTVCGEELDLGCLRTVSKSLSRNLSGCEGVILFAATLGSRVDVLLKKYTALQMSKAVVMQAAAVAMLEDYCDEINGQLKFQYEQKHLYLRPRFSPGYGDFSLSCQREIAAALELGKRIGITLTDSLLMVPTKSVTAVIGIAGTQTGCIMAGCESCGNQECTYRR